MTPRFRSALLGLAAALAPAAARATPPALPAGTDAADSYILGVNDDIRVAVLGRADTAIETRIKEDGTIVFPFIGTVAAAGQTRRALGGQIAAKLKSGGYFVDPQVGVDVVTVVSQTVTVFGQVQQPGVVPLDRTITVAMAIAFAHGALPDGADYAVLRPAGGGAERRVYFDDLDAAAMPLRAGDTLFVPESEKVFVYGQVGAPGGFRIVRGMTVRQALTRAGGVTLAGSEKSLRLFRDGKELKKVPLETAVRDKDVIRVNERLF